MAIRDRLRETGQSWSGVTNNQLCYRTSEVAAILAVPAWKVIDYIRRGMFQDIETREPLMTSSKKSRKTAWKYRIPHPAVDQFLIDYPMLFTIETLPDTVHRRVFAARPSDVWLNAKAACRALDIPRSTLHDLTRKGVIPSRKVLDQWYYRKIDLETYRRKGNA